MPSSLSFIIVDDDPFMLKVMAKTVDQIGVTQISACSSAEEALKLMSNRNHHFDILLCDLNMPGMDGIEMLRHLGAMGTRVGIALVSGEDPRLLDSVRSLAAHYNLQILGALNKPLSKDALLKVVEDYKDEKETIEQGPGALIFAEEISTALINKEFAVYFQPQVAVSDKRLIGLEALARWNHPDKGVISPGVFIGLAEKYNLIEDLTEFMTVETIKHLGDFVKIGLDVTASVNMSNKSLVHLDLPEIIIDNLKRHKVPARHLIAEVTESLLSQDVRVSQDILTRLRLKGIGLSIDDFGTGFSSMEQLKNLPFTELKIDRSFVHGAAQDNACQAILESSVNLAKRLGIKTVAEGVETQEDWDLIDSLGVDIVQGYYIAKPMPAEDISRWIKTYALKVRNSATNGAA